MGTQTEKLSYTVPQLTAATGLTRNRIYAAIATGDLRSFKVGKRRMISDEAVREFIENCERRTAEGQSA